MHAAFLVPKNNKGQIKILSPRTLHSNGENPILRAEQTYRGFLHPVSTADRMFEMTETFKCIRWGF